MINQRREITRHSDKFIRTSARDGFGNLSGSALDIETAAVVILSGHD